MVLSKSVNQRCLERSIAMGSELCAKNRNKNQTLTGFADFEMIELPNCRILDDTMMMDTVSDSLEKNRALKSCIAPKRRLILLFLPFSSLMPHFPIISNRMSDARIEWVIWLKVQLRNVVQQRETTLSEKSDAITTRWELCGELKAADRSVRSLFIRKTLIIGARTLSIFRNRNRRKNSSQGIKFKEIYRFWY